jgi:hypothetical protein
VQIFTLSSLLVIYLVMGTILFTTWLKFFQRDTSLVFEDKVLSALTLVVASLLWPLVVPLAYLELISKNPYFKK